MPLPDDVVELHRDAAAIELRGIQELAKEAELVGTPCCPACDADTGHIYRINAELHEARLPHADCPSGLCGCRWRLSDRDRANLERLLRGAPRLRPVAPAFRHSYSGTGTPSAARILVRGLRPAALIGKAELAVGG